MPSKPVAGFLACLLAFTTSCASIAHGTTQKIPVLSQPPGADVTLKCLEGTVKQKSTPTTVEIKRNRTSCSIEVAKEGFRTETFLLVRNLSGWYLGNILIGGLIGFIVDAADGAMFTQSPDRVNARLATLPRPATLVAPIAASAQPLNAEAVELAGCKYVGPVTESLGEAAPTDFALLPGESVQRRLLRYKSTQLGGNRAVAVEVVQPWAPSANTSDTRVIGHAYRCEGQPSN